MGKRRLFVGFVLLLIVVLLVALVLYIRPAKSLDLRYSSIDWKEKLLVMAETRQPALNLSESELNQLAKKELNQYVAEQELPVNVTGAEFRLNGNRLTADLNVAWGAIEAGVEAGYLMEYSSGKLLLVPENLSIRRFSFPPANFGLEPISIDLGQYLPEVVKVKEVNFQEKALRISFKLDWIEVARYLDLL